MPRSFHLLWIVALLVVLGLWLAFRDRELRSRASAPSAAAEGPRAEPTPADLIAMGVEQERRPQVSIEDSARRPEPTTARAPASAPFHGHVLDVNTGEPIPWLRLDADGTREKESFSIRADARFASGEALVEGVEEFRFYDDVNHTHVRTLSREHLEPDPADPGGWLARIAIGPTYRLSVPESDDPHLDGWHARLIESGADGKVLATNTWASIHPFDPPFLRYDNPKPSEPGSTFVVEVMSPDGTRHGRSATLVSSQGIYPEIVVIHADDVRATVRGRVVDTEGKPKSKAVVSAAWLDQPSAPDAWPATETDGEGAFEFQSLLSGVYRFTARPRRGERPATLRVELAPGVVELPDLVVPAQEPAGMVEGRLVNASGEPLATQEHVRLRALEAGGPDMLEVTSLGGVHSFRVWRKERLADLLLTSGRGEEGELVFVFEEVPAGRFELSVVGSTSRWDPPAILVEAPSDTAVFRRRDDLPGVDVRLLAVDAESGAQLAPFFAQLQLGRAWNPDCTKVSDPDEPFARVTAGAPFRWTLFAPGFRPARGDERGLRRTERGLEAVVPLARGFGARFVLRDVGVGYLHDDESGWISANLRPPVGGATILADGAPVARSDEHGVADVELAHAPDRFEIHAPGWRVIGSAQFQDGCIVGESPDVLVWLIAE